MARHHGAAMTVGSRQQILALSNFFLIPLSSFQPIMTRARPISNAVMMRHSTRTVPFVIDLIGHVAHLQEEHDQFRALWNA